MFPMINIGWIPGYLQTTGRLLRENQKRNGGYIPPEDEELVSEKGLHKVEKFMIGALIVAVLTLVALFIFI